MTRAEDLAHEVNSTFADGRISFDSYAAEGKYDAKLRAPPRTPAEHLILGNGAKLRAALRAGQTTATIAGRPVYVCVADGRIIYWTDPARNDELVGYVGNMNERPEP